MSIPKWVQIVLKVLISLAILSVLVLNIKPDQLARTLESLTWWQLGMVIVAYLFCQFISAWRWHRVAHDMQMGGTLFQFFRYYLMGMFFGLFMPTAVGGDVGRALLLSREKGSTWLKAFLSIFAERASGLVGLLTYVSAGLFVLRDTPGLVIGFWVVFPLLIAAAGFTFGFQWIEHHRWGHWFIHRFVVKQDTGDVDPGKFWPHTWALVGAVVLSLAFHGLSLLLQLAVLGKLGSDVPFYLMAAIYGLAGLASMLPVSFNGIGLREGAVVYLLVTWANVPQATATAFSLVWLSVLLLATVPGGLLTLRHSVLRSVRTHKTL